MKTRHIAAALAASTAAGLASWAALAEPVNDRLTIDGVEMIVRAKAPDGHPFAEVLSGWLYREAETRVLETDTFQNPGMLAVERGQDVWNTIEGSAGKSCASCHGDAADSMKGLGASYPKWDEASKRPINLELRIDKCRVENMGAEAYKFDHEDQKALVTFIKHQSLGAPMSVDLSQGDMQAWWEKGKEVYYTRTGQLNFSCASCHEQNNGKYIRADHLSQGNINGFPTYRLSAGGMISLHNRFRGCIRDTRAEQPKAFSDELMALEVYLTWRGSGLSIETPAVRQ